MLIPVDFIDSTSMTLSVLEYQKDLIAFVLSRRSPCCSRKPRMTGDSNKLELNSVGVRFGKRLFYILETFPHGLEHQY